MLVFPDDNKQKYYNRGGFSILFVSATLDKYFWCCVKS